MAVYDPGDRVSYHLEDDEGLDEQGYCLTRGSSGGNHVAKTSASDDDFVGVNFRSTLDEEDESVLEGDDKAKASVEQDGVVNMLCEEDDEYDVGEAVYLSADTDGVATLDDDGGSATRVGSVARHKDHSDADGPELVPVRITGYV